MNGRVVLLGGVLLIVGIPTAIYSTTNLVTSSGNQGFSTLQTTYPYQTQGLILALVGIILVVVGMAMRRTRMPAESGQAM